MMIRPALLACICNLAFFCTSFAQNIPNGDFEDWEILTEDGKSFDAPAAGWQTSRSMQCSLISKSTDAYQGTYAVLLETGDCGTSGMREAFITNVLPYSSHPSHLSGWYKSVYNNAGNAVIAVYMHRWNAIMQEQTPVGYAELVIRETQSEYTHFSVPLRYFIGGNPDTVEIGVFSDVTVPATAGNKLLVDHLQLTNEQVGLSDESALNVYKVHPVPATSDISFEYTLQRSARIKVTIMDVTGRIIAVENTYKSAGNNSTKMDVQQLKNGVYFYLIETDNHSRISGKFSKQ